MLRCAAYAVLIAARIDEIAGSSTPAVSEECAIPEPEQSAVLMQKHPARASLKAKAKVEEDDSDVLAADRQADQLSAQSSSSSAHQRKQSRTAPRGKRTKVKDDDRGSLSAHQPEHSSTVSTPDGARAHHSTAVNGVNSRSESEHQREQGRSHSKEKIKPVNHRSTVGVDELPISPKVSPMRSGGDLSASASSTEGTKSVETAHQRSGAASVGLSPIASHDGTQLRPAGVTAQETGAPSMAHTVSELVSARQHNDNGGGARGEQNDNSAFAHEASSLMDMIRKYQANLWHQVMEAQVLHLFGMLIVGCTVMMAVVAVTWSPGSSEDSESTKLLRNDSLLTASQQACMRL